MHWKVLVALALGLAIVPIPADGRNAETLRSASRFCSGRGSRGGCPDPGP